MDNLKPINTGNAKNINEVCTPIIKLIMIRYEAIFDFYSEEPYSINVQINEGDNKYKLEQIIRVRKWGNNTRSYSLSIYSQQRELGDNLNLETENMFVVRQVVWEMNADIDKIKNYSPENKQKLLNSWPSIQANNLYVSSKDTTELIKWISEVDKLVKHGIVLETNNNPTWGWKDLEFKRLYNWGGIQATWSPIKSNVNIEAKIEELEKYFKSISSIENNDIYLLELDYSIKLEIFKNSVTGNDN